MKKVPLILLLVSSFNVSRSQCNPPSQEICMVTADTLLHTYAVVIWEKVVTEEIDSFFIYRKNTSGSYDKIGTTHYSDPGEFWDYNSNLGQNTSGKYKYKISSLDTCGNESSLSPYHKPVYLQYFGAGNFHYDDYEIEFQTPNYPFELHMDITGVGNSWQVIQAVPPGFFDMFDFNYNIHPLAVYHVRITLPYDCDPTRIGVHTSRSNIKNQTVVNSLGESEESFLQVYPNPSSGIINFDFKPGLQITRVTVFNSLGNQIRMETKTCNHLDLNDLAPGLYNLQIVTNVGNANKTIILE